MADVWDELALLQGSPSTAPTQPVASLDTASDSSFGRQLAFDIPAGIATAGAGLLDVLSLPVTAAARGLGASPEEARYFALSKELQKAKEDVAKQYGLVPDTTLQEAISFITPSPVSKAKLASQAGMGLASYLGFKGAQAAAPESPTTQLIASLAAPLTPAAIRGVGRAGQTLGQSAGVVLGREQALQRAANEAVLQSLGPQGLVNVTEAVAPAATYGAGGLPLTLAEVAQSPSAALRQAVIQQTPEGAVGLTPAIEARKEAIATALGDIGVTPQTGEFPLLLQDAAAAAAAKKATSEKALIESLGLTQEVRQQTPMEKGAALIESLLSRQKTAAKKADTAWEQWTSESKSTLLDAKTPLTQALDTFRQFDPLDKADLSKTAKRVMGRVANIVDNKDGFTTVGSIQAIRSAAGRALTKASGINKTETKLMKNLRDAIDTAGLKYAYEQDIGVAGGLPGTAATASDLNALTKLSKAIEATRVKYQTFGEDVVGSLLRVRKNKLTTKASDVLNKVFAKPENVQEIIDKFGDKSEEALSIRAEFLNRLEKANNPTEFIGKNKDTAKRIFKSDYNNVVKYAQSVGQDAPLENFARVSESMIPKKIFGNVRETDAFVKEFKNTLAHDFAKSRFLTSQILKRGANPIDNWNQNKAIAKKLFGDEYNSVEALLKDKAISESPTKLATLATKGQSWTSQMRTAYGAAMSARGVIGLLKRGTIPGGISGTALGYAVAGPAGGAAASLLGSIVGYKLERLGALRESQLNALEAQLFANPRLLKLASSAPTKENVSSLMDTIADLTVGGGKAGANISTSEAPSEKSNVWDELSALE